MAEDKKTPTDEEVAATKAAEEKAFNDRLNAAVTTHTKRLEKSFSDKIEELKKALTPAAKVDDDDGDDEEEPAKGEDGKQAAAAPTPKKVDPVARRALAEAKKANEALATERAARQAAEAATRTTEERTSTKSALEEGGCTGALQRAAMAVLREDGRIARDAEGNLVFRTKKGADIEEEPLVDGVKAWLSSDEGKTYLPPRDVAGSGSSKGSPNAPAGKQTEAQRRAAAAQTLMDFAMGGRR